MRYFDNDMDELFNKAGKEYPLNTGKKDWNAVQKALASEKEAPVKSAAGKNFKRFYPLLILLLLLPVLFYELDNNVDRIASINGKNNTPNANTNSSTNKNTDATSGTNANTKPTNNTNAGASTNPIANTNPNTNTNTTDKNTTDKNTTNTNRANPNTLSNNASRNLNNTQTSRLNEIRLNNNSSNNVSLNNHVSLNKKNVDLNIANSNTSDEKNLELFLFPFKQLSEQFAHPYAAVPEPQIKNEPPAAPASAKQKLNKRYPSFYYGVMAGPDISTIKYQDIKNVGSGVGLLLGYRFSQHWSVEASGYWSTKRYFTDGKYFDKANANVPAYVELYFLDGGCQMIELPIDVRYQFRPGKNSFYVTAGLNSYFMKKESYDYKADASGSVYDGHRNYKNSGNNIFSNLQLSGGYQHKLFSKFIIRIEPYLQVPLREVGIGKMPITSAGVHFGLVRETK